jgi:hypothetical protein
MEDNRKEDPVARCGSGYKDVYRPGYINMVDPIEIVDRKREGYFLEIKTIFFYETLSIFGFLNLFLKVVPCNLLIFSSFHS